MLQALQQLLGPTVCAPAPDIGTDERHTGMSWIYDQVCQLANLPTFWGLVKCSLLGRTLIDMCISLMCCPFLLLLVYIFKYRHICSRVAVSFIRDDVWCYLNNQQAHIRHSHPCYQACHSWVYGWRAGAEFCYHKIVQLQLAKGCM
jgi:hypothetical protein